LSAVRLDAANEVEIFSMFLARQRRACASANVGIRTNANPWRHAVNKILTAAAAAFFALTSLVGSSAEAGFNLRIPAPAGVVHQAGGCGGGSYGRIYRSYRPRSYSSVSRRAKTNVASKPAAKPVTVAKEQSETKVEAATTAAKVENSSISATEGDVAEVKAPVSDKKVTATNEVGCKKFFPSVGMTLSVPCE
jgi:hypothetical protein